MSYAKNQADYFNLGYIGWKYYNTIRKKAVEQEFSWSGLFISLSIAFFVVIVSALLLSFIFHSIITNQAQANSSNKKIYYLEKSIRADAALKQNLIYINIS
jgi:hypothetical protein